MLKAPKLLVFSAAFATLILAGCNGGEGGLAAPATTGSECSANYNPIPAELEKGKGEKVSPDPSSKSSDKAMAAGEYTLQQIDVLFKDKVTGFEVHVRQSGTPLTTKVVCVRGFTNKAIGLSNSVNVPSEMSLSKDSTQTLNFKTVGFNMAVTGLRASGTDSVPSKASTVDQVLGNQGFSQNFYNLTSSNSSLYEVLAHLDNKSETIAISVQWQLKGASK